MATNSTTTQPAPRSAQATTNPATGNPATTVSPVTGKRQGPPRKPLAPMASTAPRNAQGTVPGTAGAAKAPVRTPKAAPKAAPAKAAPKATKAQQAALAANASQPHPASRTLPRNLVLQVATLYKDASVADRQRVANYLKVVTTGTSPTGARWWPDHTNLPRPSHWSWDQR